MAMMKMCRCGKLIEYKMKSCKECEQLISKDNKARQSIYNRYQRNEEVQNIYNDPKWGVMKGKADYRDVGLCRLCLDSKTITLQQAVHHIIELKENLIQAFSLNNLICLCESCHQNVHSSYKRSDEARKQIQIKLFNIITQPLLRL